MSRVCCECHEEIQDGERFHSWDRALTGHASNSGLPYRRGSQRMHAHLGGCPSYWAEKERRAIAALTLCKLDTPENIAQLKAELTAQRNKT